MKYRINKNFADNYKGKMGEGLSLELEYSLRKRDYADDLIQIRDGKAEDIDGIVSILLEYGVLEEVDSEDDDSEEETDPFTPRWIIASKASVDNFNAMLNKIEGPVLPELPELLLNSMPTSPWIDRVILEINGNKKLYIFSALAPDKRTEENLLSECLEHISKRNKKVTEESYKEKDFRSFLNEISEKLQELVGPDEYSIAKHEKRHKEFLDYIENSINPYKK